MRHIGIKLSVLVQSPLWVQQGEYTLAKWSMVEKKMESPPRLGLGTINIAPFMKGLIYY